MIEKLDFLLGQWHLDYRIPKSVFSEATTGTGSGIFKRSLQNQYIVFDYESLIDRQTTNAHGIFAWDAKAALYRYWWFESSGNYLSATCNMINDDTLFMNWHDTLLIQTFRRIDVDRIVLKMEHPDDASDFLTILEVAFSRQA